MSNINIDVINKFFEYDTNIKKVMILCARCKDYSDEDSIIQFSDDLYDSLDYIFPRLKSISNDLIKDKPVILDKVRDLEKRTRKAFGACHHNINKLRKFYNDSITYMDPNFIETVKESCVGYTGHHIDDTAKKVLTINEMLHLMHSYIINNENILGSISVIDEKNNNYGYPIRLRGKSNPIFHQLFMNFPQSIDVGWTDMVAVNDNKLVMMVRDRGHALTIEITVNDKNEAKVEYFIPKVTNIDMVNSLPGINPSFNPDAGATGIMEIPLNELPNTLYSFISKVPMDMDAPTYGGSSR